MTNDLAYNDLLSTILFRGSRRPNRTGVDAISIFGFRMVFNLYNYTLPLITTKKVSFHNILHELIWYLSGDTNIKYLTDNGVNIWNEWADENGNLGPVYGKQWTDWNGINQIERVVESIKTDPYSRRHIVSAWNVAELEDMALPPCHLLFQFYVHNGTLSCQLYQRSADAFLGVPYNIACYSLLTHLIAHTCGLKAAEFIHTIGDAHIYENHVEQVRTQLDRDSYDSPKIKIHAKHDRLADYKFDDFELIDYEHGPTLHGAVAV